MKVVELYCKFDIRLSYKYTKVSRVSVITTIFLYFVEICLASYFSLPLIAPSSDTKIPRENIHVTSCAVFEIFEAKEVRGILIFTYEGVMFTDKCNMHNFPFVSYFLVDGFFLGKPKHVA